MNDKAKYVVVTPVRDEEKFIGLTLESMINQTLHPIQWIIVDDCSADRTAEIVKTYVRENPWIKLVAFGNQGPRKRGSRVVEIFDYGYSQINLDHDYIVKLDGDLSFDARYFEELFAKFSDNQELGIAGGSCYIPYKGEWRLEKVPLDHVRGATKVYRKTCFNEIGGLEPVNGWDNIDEWRAQMRGWETRSFIDLKIYQHKITGASDGVLGGRIKQGENSYFLGYTLPLILARSLYRSIIDRPIILAGLAIFWGYLKCWTLGTPRFDDPEIRAYLRKHKLRRMAFWRS